MNWWMSQYANDIIKSTICVCACVQREGRKSKLILFQMKTKMRETTVLKKIR